MEYKPDATIISKKRSKIVFQVLDTQAEKNREIESDLIRCFLSPDVSIMIFITETPEYAKNVERISSILSENLIDYGIRNLMIPITVALAIPRAIRSAQDTLRHFRKIRGRLIAHI